MGWRDEAVDLVGLSIVSDSPFTDEYSDNPPVNHFVKRSTTHGIDDERTRRYFDTLLSGRDKNNIATGGLYQIFGPNGEVGTELETRRNVNGVDKYNNVAQYLDANGNASTYFADPNAWRIGLGEGRYGQGFVVTDNTTDAAASNNGHTGNLWPYYLIRDKYGRVLARFEAYSYENGNTGFSIYAKSYDTSGIQTAQTGISLQLTKAGVATYSVGAADKFRTALGLGSWALKSSGSVTLSTGDGWPTFTSGNNTLAASNAVTITLNISVPNGYHLVSCICIDSNHTTVTTINKWDLNVSNVVAIFRNLSTTKITDQKLTTQIIYLRATNSVS